jgi:hypothetical protein
LAQLPDTALFRCKNCDRVLKVPESLRRPQAATVATPAATPRRGARREPEPESAPEPTVASKTVSGNGTTSRTRPPAAAPTAATRVVRTPPAAAPAAGPKPPASRPRLIDAPSSLRLPWPVRTIVWLVALPVGLAMSAVFLRVIGVLNVESAMNIFVGTGAGRFGAVIALVPLWAFVSALIAHFALEGLARFWFRRA